MIDQALAFIRDELNAHLNTVMPMEDADRVVASNIVPQETDSGNSTTVTDMRDNSIIFSLINIEEEKVFKDQSKFSRGPNNSIQSMEPELKLNLHVIFAAHYNDYLTGIKALSEVIGFFQSNRVFDADRFPNMNPVLQKLIVELHTFALSQSFEFWQSLGGSFLPSITYKIRMLIVQQAQVQGSAPPTGSIGINTSTN
jgi:hypothetical protein